MKLFSLHGNFQRLDGGALFGNAPKTIWSSWVTSDNSNRVALACRCLLIVIENKTILLETGIGAFFDPKYKIRYGVIEEQHELLASLAKIGYSHIDINYIVLSHLHFDHAGGLLSAWQIDQEPQLLFPNAEYIVSQAAWERAINPHPRDKASFIPKLNHFLKDSNRLRILSKHESFLEEHLTFHLSDGHTPGLLLTEIKTTNGPMLFASDLIPGIPWVHLPITMGYDRYPEKIIDEKKAILDYIIANKGWLFFTHDPAIACAQISLEQNRYSAINQLTDIEGDW